MNLRVCLLACLLSLAACSGMPNGFDIGNLSPTAVMDIGENAFKAATLTDEDVKKLAANMVKELDRENKVAPAGNSYSKRLEKIVARHKKEEGLNLNYKVYLSPEVNAFSTADGSIRVYSGLMDKMNDDELLFVIGHEIGHVKHGHRKSRMQRGYAAAAAAGAIGQGLSAATPNSVAGVGVTIGGDLLAQLTAEVLKAQFSQGDETESDEFGLHLVHKRQRPLDASVSALLKLKGDDGGSGSSTLEQFTSSHPDPEERAEHLKELIPTLGGVVAAKQEKPSEEKTQLAKNDSSVNQEAQVDQKTPKKGLDGSHEALHASEHSPASVPAITAVLPAPSDDSAGAKSLARLEQPIAPPQSLIDKKLSGGGWYVQVGAFSNKNSAQNITSSLQLHKVSVQAAPCSSRGHTVYKVLVGPFSSEGEAKSQLRELQQNSDVGGDSFVRGGSSC
jgi:putative metalloprotease